MRGQPVPLAVIGVILDRDRHAAGRQHALGHLDEAVQGVVGDGAGFRRVEVVDDRRQMAVGPVVTLALYPRGFIGGCWQGMARHRAIGTTTRMRALR